MQFEILHRPTHATLDFQLNQGDRIIAQPDSMLAMSTGIEIEAKVGAQTSSGMIGGFRNLLSGESFFTAIYVARKDGQYLSLAPRFLGDIVHLNVDDDHGFYITRGSYLANTSDVSIEFKYGGMRGVLAKKGLFLMHTIGTGEIFCSSFGAVIRRELDVDEQFVVDNRYVIAFSDTVKYQLVKAAKGLKNAFFSGEGLVNRYRGPGTVIYQSRGNPNAVSLIGRMFDMAT